jgi:hypothetical protein
MNPSSDTPPDGDFVAYVNRLTGGKSGTEPREELFPSRTDAPDGPPLEDGAETLSIQTITQVLRELSFHKHLLGLLAAWLVAQGVEWLVPEADFLGLLFTLVLLADLGWVVYKVNLSTSGALAKRVVELARQAEAARIARISRKPHL